MQTSIKPGANIYHIANVYAKTDKQKKRREEKTLNVSKLFPLQVNERRNKLPYINFNKKHFD